MLNRLIDEGSDLNAKSGNAGFSPLHWAILRDHLDIVDTLVARGADINCKDGSGQSPIEKAAFAGNGWMVGRLLGAANEQLVTLATEQPAIKALVSKDFTHQLASICNTKPELSRAVNQLPFPGTSEWRGMLASEWCALAELYLKAHATVGMPLDPYPIPLAWLIHGRATFREQAKAIQDIPIGKCRMAQDMFREFATYVLLPALLLRSGIADNDSALCNIESARLVDALIPSAVKCLTWNRDLAFVLKTSEAWHLTHHAFPSDRLRPFASNGEWYPLIEQKSVSVPQGHPASGWSIQIITNTNDLGSEGAALKHCVGGGNYAERCMSDLSSQRCHILALEDDKGIRVSTVELGDDLAIRQHRGDCNRAPPPMAETALSWFIAQLNSGAISVNEYRGETRASRETRRNLAIPSVLRTIGFRPTVDAVNEALQHYQMIFVRRNRRNSDFTYMDSLLSGYTFVPDGRTSNLIDGTEYATGETKFYATMGVNEFLEVSGLGAELDSVAKAFGLTQLAAKSSRSVL